jgi:hypothetical protein
MSCLCSDITASFSRRSLRRSCVAWDTIAANSEVGGSSIPCLATGQKHTIISTNAQTAHHFWSTHIFVLFFDGGAPHVEKIRL